MTKQTDNKSQVLAFVGSGRKRNKKNNTSNEISETKKVETITPSSRKVSTPNKKENKLRKKQVGLVITPELYERARYTAWKEKKSLNSFIFDLLDKNSVPLEEVEDY